MDGTQEIRKCSKKIRSVQQIGESLLTFFQLWWACSSPADQFDKLPTILPTHQPSPSFPVHAADCCVPWQIKKYANSPFRVFLESFAKSFLFLYLSSEEIQHSKVAVDLFKSTCRWTEVFVPSQVDPSDPPLLVKQLQLWLLRKLPPEVVAILPSLSKMTLLTIHT